jgi:ribosomal protein S6
MENTYELMIILSSALDETAQTKAVNQIKALIAPSGSVVSEQKIGKKTFSYPIKKNKEGIYWNFKLKFSSKDMKSFVNKLNQEDSILRHLMIESGKV